MLTNQAIVTFPLEEYKKLEQISTQYRQSISDLIRETIKRTLLTEEETPFDNLKAFGIWANNTRSDQEILDDIGGNWSNFPLNE